MALFTPKDVSFITVLCILGFRTMFEEAYKKLLKNYKNKYPHKYYCIDYVKNIYGKDCVGKNPTDRGGKATKLSVIVDEKGVPHSLHASEGNVSDMKLLEISLQNMLFILLFVVGCFFAFWFLPNYLPIKMS